MVRAVVALAACVACAAGRLPESAAVHAVSLAARSQTTDRQFEGTEKLTVLQGFERLLGTCSVDSIEYPSIFPEAGSVVWQRVLSGARLHARYPNTKGFRWASGSARFSELLLEVPQGRYPGVLLGRGPLGVVQFTKCDGVATIRLSCLPELCDIVPASYRHSCHLESEL